VSVHRFVKLNIFLSMFCLFQNFSGCHHIALRVEWIFVFPFCFRLSTRQRGQFHRHFFALLKMSVESWKKIIVRTNLKRKYSQKTLASNLDTTEIQGYKARLKKQVEKGSSSLVYNCFSVPNSTWNTNCRKEIQ
jgi:hypothetical protein